MMLNVELVVKGEKGGGMGHEQLCWIYLKPNGPGDIAVCPFVTDFASNWHDIWRCFTTQHFSSQQQLLQGE